jgi:beta-galactosidase
LNGRSLGKRSKQGDDLHVMWRVKYEPGTLKAVSRKNGKEVLTKEISTAGNPVKIRLTPDRNIITANGKDLSFVTVELVDKNDNAYPLANHFVKETGTSFVFRKMFGNCSKLQKAWQNYLESFSGRFARCRNYHYCKVKNFSTLLLFFEQG